jgi:GNAT superfamily N-acetyltransferase
MPQSDPHHRILPAKFDYFTPDPTSPSFPEKVRELAECYQLVYGMDDSWNEGRVCRVCSTPRAPKKWNLREAPAVCECGQATELFWPVETIVDDMRREFLHPDAACVVARFNGRIVGGAWGFSASAVEMEEHLNRGLPEEVHVQGVAEALERMFPGQRIAYQDEIFVHPDLQGMGIGGGLFRQRHAKFVERGLVGYVLRTKMNPPSRSFRWYGSPRWGYKKIGFYPDVDQRVVMAVSFEHLARHGIIKAT